MRYYVILGSDPSERPIVVDVVELPNGTLQVHIDTRAVDVDVVTVGKQLNVRVRGHVVDLTTQGSPPDIEVCASGLRTGVRVESERMRSAESRGRPRAASGEKHVKSPMPGRVVRVLVAKGQAVRAGQGLVVLEAMKMENEVRARTAGTVADVHVAPGTTVDRNATLVSLH